MIDSFDLDKHGNLVTQPVMEFKATDLAGTSVLLTVLYLQDLRELAEGGESQRVQLLLTAQKALELADLLKRAAERALRIPPGTTFQ
jgi:hypothetical protein